MRNAAQALSPALDRMPSRTAPQTAGHCPANMRSWTQCTAACEHSDITPRTETISGHAAIAHHTSDNPRQHANRPPYSRRAALRRGLQFPAIRIMTLASQARIVT